MTARTRHEQPTELQAALTALTAALADARGESEVATSLLRHAMSLSGATGGRVVRLDNVGAERVLAEVDGQAAPAPVVVEGGRDAPWRLSFWGAEPASAGVLKLALGQAIVAAEREAFRRELDLRDARDARLQSACETVGAPTGPVEAARRVAAAARVLLDADAAAFLPGPGAERFPIVWDGIGGSDGSALPEAPAAAARSLSVGAVWAGELASGESLARHGFRSAAAAPVGQRSSLLVAFASDEPAPRGELELLGLFAERATTVLDVAERTETAGRLSALDEVTGLYNAAYFRVRLEQEASRAMRSRSTLSVLAVGLPQGVSADESGDHLRTVVDELQASLRVMDVACRIADDEIAVILPELDGMSAYLVGERLRTVAAGDRESARVAVGVASFPDQAGSAGELARNAARALAWARHHGSDRTFLFDRDVALGLRVDQERERERKAEALTALYAVASHIDAREGAGANHSHNVGRISGLLARQLGLTPAHADLVRTAGLLHDVGKLGVRDDVLSKPDPLTEDDREELRQHTLVGERMLSGTELGEVRQWVLHHHERMDGSGYPAGLSGEEIPLEARIIAVAEALDVMVHDSAYRPAVGPQEAIDELRRCAGNQFDPRVVDALLELVARGVPGVIPG